MVVGVVLEVMAAVAASVAEALGVGGGSRRPP